MTSINELGQKPDDSLAVRIYQHEKLSLAIPKVRRHNNVPKGDILGRTTIFACVIQTALYRR